MLQLSKENLIHLKTSYPSFWHNLYKKNVLDQIHYDTDTWTSLKSIFLFHFRVGNGSPSKILSVNTKGGPPQLPKEKDFILTNSTTLQLNLFNWPDGGCPITKFSITYRALGEQKWTLVSPSVSGDKLVVENLSPATWYQLSAAARNDAGVADGLFNFATTSLTGGE